MLKPEKSLGKLNAEIWKLLEVGEGDGVAGSSNGPGMWGPGIDFAKTWKNSGGISNVKTWKTLGQGDKRRPRWKGRGRKEIEHPPKPDKFVKGECVIFCFDFEAKNC